MTRAKIFLLCLASAITYGVLHDQITARICLEYFTVAHPPLFSATTPTLLALYWGVTATAGMGAILGLLLAMISHAGSAPPLHPSRLLKPIARLLATMALAALVSGVCGFFLAQRGMISLPVAVADAIPQTRHQQFMAVWFAHVASYLVGISGSAFLVFSVWRARGRPVVISLFPRTPLAAIRAAIVAGVAAYVLWMRFFLH